jgi:hypothetical protein
MSLQAKIYNSYTKRYEVIGRPIAINLNHRTSHE